MLKICFFVPEKNKENVKCKLFEAGAGKFRNYDCCSFETKGIGQFRPLKGSQPYLGQENILEYVEEYKVEMICHQNDIEKVISALKESHPYEEVAYEVYQLWDY